MPYDLSSLKRFNIREERQYKALTWFLRNREGIEAAAIEGDILSQELVVAFDEYTTMTESAVENFVFQVENYPGFTNF